MVDTELLGVDGELVEVVVHHHSLCHFPPFGLVGWVVQIGAASKISSLLFRLCKVVVN